MALLIQRAVVITNPASRRGTRLARQVQDALSARAVAYHMVFTERPGHAAELAVRHARDHDAVFALGGDGTVMEVASALAGSGIPIGVLAGGTGNLVARALGIPLSVRRAVPALLDGEARVVDLGRLDVGHDGVRRFAVAAGVGIDVAMLAETPAWLKRRAGVIGYALMGARAAVRAVVRREFFHARIVIDGQVVEREAVTVMIANFGDVLGRRITLGPSIRPDDGLLDVCVFSPRTLADAMRIMVRLVRGRFPADPQMHYARGQALRVETTPPMPWQADGELLGTTPLAVQVEPRAARLLVPRSTGR